MNGYKMQAEAYRKYLEKKPDEPNKEYLERQIKVNDILAECTQEDVCALYNTGAFNDITEQYCKKAMQNVGLEEKQIEAVVFEIRKLHDMLFAEEIL